MRSFLMLLVFLPGVEGLWAATFNVNSTDDAVDATPGDGVCEISVGSGECTLRAAVMEANEATGPHEINLPSGDFLLSITGVTNDDASAGDLDVRSEITIRGVGADTTRVDGDDTIQVFHVFSLLQLEDLTVQNGFAGSDAEFGTFFGGGVFSEFDSEVFLERVHMTGNRAVRGGAIYATGSLVVRESQFQRNLVSEFVSGNRQGHAIAVDSADATIESSTIANNAPGLNDAFAALSVEGGTLRMNNSTVANNESLGVYTQNADLYLSHSTLAGNSDDQLGTFSFNDDNTVEIRSSVIQHSGEFGTACSADEVQTSLGYNISSDESCNFTGAGDLQNTDAQLVRLQDNGGPTLTSGPLAGSPALDLVPPASCVDDAGDTLTVDQRGEPRPESGSANCDAGSVEGSVELSNEVFEDRFETDGGLL